MDKPDLDFLVDSGDTDLLYKYIFEAIGNSEKVRNGINRYTIDRMIIHKLSSCIIYRSKYDVNIKRIDRYVMELQ